MSMNKKSIFVVRWTASIAAASLMGVQGAQGASPSEGADDRTALAEVVVTATKHAENIEDVPLSVSALSGSAIEDLHSTQLADYAGYIPGLVVDSNGTPGQSTIILRGIVPLGDSSSVATYVDDSPVGGSDSHSKASSFALDLFPDDFQRVEVLRGPQGTLFGASSLGGVVTYVTVAPDPSGFAARIGADTWDTKGTSSAGWDVHGFLNAPLVDQTLGVRLSYFDKTQPGYITDGTTGAPHENANRVNGGRIAVLWDVSTDLVVKLSAMLQNVDSKNDALISLNPMTGQPVYGDLESAHVLPQPYWQHLSLYTGTVDWNLPWAEFISATSFSTNRNLRDQDLSISFGTLFPLLGGPPGLAPYHGDDSIKKVTQEFRLHSKLDSSWEWLIGLYGTHEHSINNQYIGALDLNQVPIPGLNPCCVASQVTTYREDSAYGEVTYHFSPSISLTGGVREAHNSQDYSTLASGSLVGPPTADYGTSSENDTLYSLSSRYFITERAMVYLRFATGYRPGGPNPQVPGFVVPPTVGADTTRNYEFGTKMTIASTVVLNADIFRVDWKNIQLLTNAAVNFAANGGEARSQGAEWSLDYAATSNLILGLTGAFTDARLTQDAPNIGGLAGDRLPSVPRWSGAVTARYSIPVNDRWRGEVGGGYRYVSDRYAVVTSAPGNFRAPPYGTVDLNARLYDANWTVSLFANNLTDRRGLITPQVLSDFMGTPVQVDSAFINPRTIGVGFTRSF